jgi:hypothetical protein
MAAQCRLREMEGPDRGLCGGCRHARLHGNRRGSEFLRCGRADTDASYRRYPALPVLACAGFEEGQAPGGDATTNHLPPPVREEV